MGFWKAQRKGALIGLAVIVIWASLDWLTMMVGWRVAMTRDYLDAFCAATAGAAAVYLFS